MTKLEELEAKRDAAWDAYDAAAEAALTAYKAANAAYYAEIRKQEEEAYD